MVEKKSLTQHVRNRLANLVRELQLLETEAEMQCEEQCEELWKAQLHAEKNANKYRELYHSLSAGCLRTDLQGRISDLNKTGAALLRISGVGQIPSFFMLFEQEPSNSILLCCRNALTHRTIQICEVPMKRLDGSLFNALLHVLPVDYRDNREDQLFVEFQDITPWHETKRALEEAHLKLREAARTELAAGESERKRIAREIHDDYCQQIVTTVLEAKALGKATEAQHPCFASRVRAISDKLTGMLDLLRTLSHDLHPPLQEDAPVESLRARVQTFAERTGLEIRFSTHDVPTRLSPLIGTALYRTLQESLLNILKHAKARHVSVSMAQKKGGIELVVADNGAGFDLGAVMKDRKGIGLVGMQERVSRLGGALSISSTTGQGTTISTWIPFS